MTFSSTTYFDERLAQFRAHVAQTGRKYHEDIRNGYTREYFQRVFLLDPESQDEDAEFAFKRAIWTESATIIDGTYIAVVVDDWIYMWCLAARDAVPDNVITPYTLDAPR